MRFWMILMVISSTGCATQIFKTSKPAKRRPSSIRPFKHTPTDRALHAALEGYAKKTNKRVQRFFKGERHPRVCRAAQALGKILSRKNLKRDLDSQTAHLGVQKREQYLLGDYIGHKGLKASRMREVVTESMPYQSKGDAAEACLKSWFSEKSSKRVFTQTPAYYCLSMAASENGRHYCVGIALY